ncbi:hypothetical protein CRE_09693 [Caenorhabditis remanei]|uniref:CCHC-type domain-containing protein n=1 Tax=Caenorhabditis remanei TaxID=31234 RepID=E3MX21_CAERE|nr:hypothetical protein CRE_09693 [Caenorhabditis remanei]
MSDKTASKQSTSKVDDDRMIVVETQMSVKDRRKKVKNFTKLIASSVKVEDETRLQLGELTTKCSETEVDAILEPMKSFHRELLEKFEEIGGDKWPRSVIRVMREFELESVAELREACAKAAEGEEAEWSVGKVNLELQQVQYEMKVLTECWNEEREMLGEQIRKVQEEKEVAEIQVSKLEKALKQLRKTLERQERRPNGLWDETQGSRSWCERVENWDIERNDERSRKKGGEDAFSRKTLSHSGSSEVNDMMQCMNRMLKSSALPEPKTFDGTGEFKEFKRAFLLKYNHVTENDYELVAILEEKFLKGAAKSLFKTLPKRFERSIQSLFEEFEQKLRKRQGDSKIEALNEFEGLEKRSDQKMWEYLVEVEKWSRKAFPEVKQETLSQMRTTKLMKAVRGDETLHKMLIMKRFELSLEEQYDHLKDIVLQQENEQRRGNGQKSGYSEGWKGRKDSQWKEREEERPKAENDGEKGETVADRGSGEKQYWREQRCFSCGGVGHLARQCSPKPVQSVEVRGKGEGVGIVAVETVMMLGQERKMVIDSGAAVSVMSTGAWNGLKKGCRNWMEVVKRLGKPNFEVIDTSKKKMRIIQQIEVPIQVRDRKAEVVFQLVENDAEIMLLGTNAFESIGVSVEWKQERTDVQQKKGKRDARSREEKKVFMVGNLGIRVENTKLSGKTAEKSKEIAVDTVTEEKKEGMKPKKTVIRESKILITPRIAVKGKSIFEYRKSALNTWKDKFDFVNVESIVFLLELTEDEETNQKLGNLVRKLAEEVKEITIIPYKMDWAESGLVESWKRSWITAGHVKWSDSAASAGEKFKTWEQLLEFLEARTTGNVVVAQLRKESVTSEPRIKENKWSHQ